MENSWLDSILRALDYSAGVGRYGAAGLANIPYSIHTGKSLTTTEDLGNVLKGKGPTASEYLERAGGKGSPWLDLAADISTDPTTYLTGGASALPKMAAMGALKKGAKKSVLDLFEKKALEEAAKVGWKSREKLIMMPIDDFLSMAKAGKDEAKLANVKELMDAEKPFSSIPRLYGKSEGEAFQITGHEGRHRARALKEAGYTEIPVIVNSRDIRWSEQVDPALFDYVKEWPKAMTGEQGAKIGFPIERESANTPFLNILKNKKE